MPRLLPSKSATIFLHILVNIFIANSRFGITNSQLVKSFIKSKIGHHCCNNSICNQFLTFLHVSSIDIKNCVSIDYISLFIYAKTTICISIIGKTNIQSFLDYKLLQSLSALDTITTSKDLSA